MERPLWDRLQQLLVTDPAEVDKTLQPEAKQNSTDPEVWLLLGIANFRMRRLSLAEKAFRRAVFYDSSSANAWYYLGLCAEHQEHSGEAVKAYRVAAALDPNMSLAREKLQALTSGSLNEPPSPVRVQHDSRLMLPKSDEDFDDYERRIRKADLIEARSQYSAQMRALPVWIKAAMAVVAILFLAGVLFTVISIVTSDADSGQQVEEFCRDLRERFDDNIPAQCR